MSHDTKMGKDVESHPQRHLAFISLALGFLVIWTAVLAGVLVSKTLKDDATSKEATRVFRTHEDVGKLSFALGHEMVSTVDWLLSPKRKDDEENKQKIITVTWKITDSVIKNVRDTSLQRWVGSVVGVLDMLENKLSSFRNTLRPESNPLDVTTFYLRLNDLMLKRCFLLDYLSYQLPVPSLSYTLFIRGMSQRFGELALGAIYVKTSLPLNSSEYLSLKAGSEELMESAFHFTPRARSKWWELQERDPSVHNVLAFISKDIISGSKSRGQRELATAYLDSVKEQIAMLLLTKEVFNSTLAAWIEKLSERSHNTLAFHMSISVVALIAVMLCLIITGCTFRYMGKRNLEMIYVENRESVYNMSDKAQILPPGSYIKQHCYM